MGKSGSKLTPEALAELQDKTHFNKKELNTWYNGFLRDYPNGRLDRDQFAEFYRRFFPDGESGEFVEIFFKAVDANNDGGICFQEFIHTLSLTLRGGPDEKLKWLFEVYDINSDGTVTYDEMLQIVRSVYKLVGRTVQLPTDENTPEKRVDKLFKALDKNNDQKLTYAEFVNGCKLHPAIAEALTSLLA